MARDSYYTSMPSGLPLFKGRLFLGAVVSAVLLALDLGLWTTGQLPERVLGLKALVLTPIFAFFLVAWLARWRGYGWLVVWLVYAAVFLFMLVIAYDGYQKSLDESFRTFVFG